MRRKRLRRCAGQVGMSADSFLVCMVPLRPKVTHVNEESMATFEVAVALAVSDARSDGMLTETPTDWQSYGSPCQRTAFASCSKRRKETHSLAKGDTGSELLGRASRYHALRDTLDEGLGRAQALVVGRGARGDSSRLPDAVDDAVPIPSKEVSCLLASEREQWRSVHTRWAEHPVPRP
jgi:hypothetical protein